MSEHFSVNYGAVTNDPSLDVFLDKKLPTNEGLLIDIDGSVYKVIDYNEIETTIEGIPDVSFTGHLTNGNKIERRLKKLQVQKL